MSSVPLSNVSVIGRRLQIREGEWEMIESDNFIVRWARLKRQSDIERKIEAARIDLATEPKEEVSVPSEATAVKAAPLESAVVKAERPVDAV